MMTKQFIVGITGGSGVGKTTLIRQLYETFEGQLATLSLDNYYKPKEFQSKDSNGIINFDLPEALFIKELERDLDMLCKQETVKQEIYQFNNPNKKVEFREIVPKGILLIEGLFVMHYPFVRKRLDYSVFLSVDETTQLERRLKRDVEERNYDRNEVLYQWEHHVLPAYQNFILPYKHRADLIITNNDRFDDNVDILIETIKRSIGS